MFAGMTPAANGLEADASSRPAGSACSLLLLLVHVDGIINKVITVKLQKLPDIRFHCLAHNAHGVCHTLQAVSTLVADVCLVVDSQMLRHPKLHFNAVPIKEDLFAYLNDGTAHSRQAKQCNVTIFGSCPDQQHIFMR